MFHFKPVYEEYDISSSSLNITTDDGKEIINVTLFEDLEYTVPETVKIIAWFEIDLFILYIEEMRLLHPVYDFDQKKNMIMDEFHNQYHEIIFNIEDEKLLDTLENIRKRIVYDDIIMTKEENATIFKLDMDKLKKTFIMSDKIIEMLSSIIFYDYTMEESYDNHKKITIGAVCEVKNIRNSISKGSTRSDSAFLVDPSYFYRKFDNGSILVSNTNRIPNFHLGLNVYPTQKEGFYDVSGAGTTI